MKLNQFALAALLTCVASAASAGSYTSAGGSIPDDQPLTPLIVTFNVTETGPLASLSLTMTGLTHTWMGDIIATLSAPNGTTIDILRRTSITATSSLGSSTNFLGNYRFIDGGANIVTVIGSNSGAFNIPGGDYTASTRVVGTTTTTPLSLNAGFGGVPLLGVWKLAISDNHFLDVGSLSSATLTVTAVPEPSTYALFALGLAGLAALRRRKA